MSVTLWRLAGAAFIALVVFLIIWGHLSWLPALSVALCAGATVLVALDDALLDLAAVDGHRLPIVEPHLWAGAASMPGGLALGVRRLWRGRQDRRQS